jgi:hypothetical protein
MTATITANTWWTPYRAAVRAKANVQSALLPIGNGIELSCLWS